MSRSYRKPYSACTGHSSARWDKTTAARGVRRKQNQVLRDAEDLEALQMPHRLECHHNNTYDWKRDGGQWLHVLTGEDRADYERTLIGDFRSRWDKKLMLKRYSLWPPKWYQDLTRK